LTAYQARLYDESQTTHNAQKSPYRRPNNQRQDKPTTGRKGREKSKMKATQGSRTRSNAENGRTRSTAGKNASKSKSGQAGKKQTKIVM